MSMFPGPGAQIYKNEAGEVLGWDYPSDEPPDYDDNPYDPDVCNEWLSSPKHPGHCVRCGCPEDLHDHWDEDESDTSKDAETLALADDVEHFHASNASNLDPTERALLANTVKLIRRFA